jgi:hypothetical protein
VPRRLRDLGGTIVGVGIGLAGGDVVVDLGQEHRVVGIAGERIEAAGRDRRKRQPPDLLTNLRIGLLRGGQSRENAIGQITQAIEKVRPAGRGASRRWCGGVRRCCRRRPAQRQQGGTERQQAGAFQQRTNAHRLSLPVSWLPVRPAWTSFSILGIENCAA